MQLLRKLLFYTRFTANFFSISGLPAGLKKKQHEKKHTFEEKNPTISEKKTHFFHYYSF